MKKTRTLSIAIKIKTLLRKLSLKFEIKCDTITFIHKFLFYNK